MKIYVITAGEYSDYSIYGVAINMADAEKIAERVSSYVQEPANIEEYDTDSWQDIIRTGGFYEVIKRGNGSLDVYDVHWQIDRNYENRNKVTRLSRTPGLRVMVIARGEEHAKKIAADLFAEYEYREAMQEPKDQREQRQ